MNRLRLSFLSSVTVLIACGSSLHAAPFTWNGAAASVSFQDGGNWVGGVAAPSGSDLLFGADSGAGFAGLDAGAIFNAPTVSFLSDASSGFYITGLSSNDILNITGTGTTVTNASSFQMGTQALTVSIGGTQTWNGGANGLSIFAVDLGNNRTLTLDGAGTTAGTRNEIVFGIDGTGTSGVTKQGAGTLLFSGTNFYTGATTVSAGTLQLGASERISSSSNLVMNGGTFNTGGFDETVGKLSLTNFSTIDFGSSNASDLVFSLSSDQVWGGFTLNIMNFNVGLDTLRFGTNNTGLTSSQLLNNIRFNGTTAGQIDSNGFVTPTVVPEPSAMLLMGLGLASLVSRRRSRRS